MSEDVRSIFHRDLLGSFGLEVTSNKFVMLVRAFSRRVGSENEDNRTCMETFLLPVDDKETTDDLGRQPTEFLQFAQSFVY